VSRRFTRVDRELVELAIDLICSGERHEYALSRAAQRLRDSGRKGVRFRHVLDMESSYSQFLGWRSADERVDGLRRLLAVELDARQAAGERR
jgi:hypothetical protein